MARGHQLANVESHRAGNLVFFDFLGAFVVRWPMYVGDIINIATVIVSIYTVYFNLRENQQREGKEKIIHCLTSYNFFIACFSSFSSRAFKKISTKYECRIGCVNRANIGLCWRSSSFKCIG